MTSGKAPARRRWPIALLLATLASPLASAADLDALLARLARPAPTETPFVEQRQSALLDEPLRLTGTLQRPEAGTLVRQVDTPQPERTTIRGERVTVERGERRDRTFSLRRAPELAALLASFQALLDGDRGALEQHYSVTLAGEDARWSILLQPRTKELQRRLGTIALHGRGDQLRCVDMRGGRAGDSLMLVGEAAVEPADFSVCERAG